MTTPGGEIEMTLQAPAATLAVVKDVLGERLEPSDLDERFVQLLLGVAFHPFDVNDTFTRESIRARVVSQAAACIAAVELIDAIEDETEIGPEAAD